MVIADTFRPSEKTQSIAYDLTLVIGGSILIALSAQVRFMVPFSPVPITGQTFAVVLLGALLGSSRGAGAALAYVAQGAIGLPVFAGGGAGAAYLFGPTGGYLIGFVAAAYVVGTLAEFGWTRTPLGTAVAMIVGNIGIYAVGTSWLAVFTGPAGAIASGVVPFLVGDALKVAAAVLILPAATRAVERR